MNKLAVNKLLQLNKHKQNRVAAEIAALEQQRSSLIKQLSLNEERIAQLHTSRQAYKSNAYHETLKQASLAATAIRGVGFTLRQYDDEINSVHEEQNALSDELQQLDLNMQHLQLTMKSFIVKDEKYQYILN